MKIYKYVHRNKISINDKSNQNKKYRPMRSKHFSLNPNAMAFCKFQDLNLQGIKPLLS